MSVDSKHERARALRAKVDAIRAELAELGLDHPSLDAAIWPVAFHDASGRLTPNGAWRAMLGDATDPAAIEQAVTRLAAAVSDDGEPRREVLAWTTPSERRWVAVTAAPYAGAVLVSLVDVSEYERLRVALEEREALLVEAGRLADMGTWQLDLGTDVLHWSEETHRLFGTDPSSFVPTLEGLLRFVEPEDRPALERAFAAAAAHPDGQFQAEYRIRRTDGATRWMVERGRLERDATGRATRRIGMIMDITERKEAELAAERAHASVQSAFEGAPTGILRIDGDGCIQMMNPAFAKMIGRDESELVGTHFLALTHPADRDECEARIGALLRGEVETVSIEKRFLTASGGHVWSRVNAMREPGPTLTALGVAEDVTAYRAALDALGRQEATLRMVARMARVGGWRWMLPDELTWSDEVCAIHALPPDHRPTVAESLAYFPSEHRAPLEAAGARCLTEGVSFDLELEIIDALGRRVPVRSLGEAVRNERGQIVGMQGAFQDISARIEAERSAQQSERRFRDMADTLPLIVWTATPEGAIDFTSQAATEYFGRSGEVHLGRGWLDALHPDDVPRARAAWEEAVRTRTPYALELRFRRHDGAMRWHAVRATPIADERAHAHKWYGSAVDVHDGRVLAERLRATLESIGDGFVIVDAAGQVELANPQALVMLRPSGPSVLGRRFDEAFPQLASVMAARLCAEPPRAEAPRAENPRAESPRAETDRAETDRAETDRVESPRAETPRAESPRVGTPRVENPRVDDGPSDFEVHLSDFDVWLSGRVYATPDAGYAIYLRDVTEMREALEALRTSEERSRLLSRATHDAIWDWDVESDRVVWNEGYRRFGIDPDAPGRTLAAWKSRIHPEDLDRVQASLRAAIDAHAPMWSDEYRFQREDGTYAYVFDRGYPVFGEDGRLVRMVGGMTDLTERIETEARLREQAELLEAASDAIMVRDLDGTALYLNCQAAALYGWSREEAVGRDVRQMQFAGLVEAFEEANRATLESGAWTGELRQITHDGRPIVTRGRWTLLRDAAGRPRSVLVIDTDVTEELEREERLLRVQRMESIGTLAGGIAHDLNNVLLPVLFSAELLLRDEADAGRREDLQAIVTSAQRGADMIRQLLAFARGYEGTRSAVDVRGVVSEVVKILRDTLPKTIEIEVDVADRLWMVDADPTQLHQILLNLCVNARDAIGSWGRLRLSVRDVLVDDVYAAQHPDAKVGRYVVVRVEDSGEGIAPDVLDRIFEPFYTTKPVGKGTGLGLSTSHALVRSHGGFITVYSEPGKGSRFDVHLPAREPTIAPASEAPPPLDRRPHGAGQLLLVIDDEEAVRTMVRRTVERFGYRALVAEHGAHGVALFAAHRADVALVITDMVMPVMDGPATITALRALDPELRIIASSGLDAQGRLVGDATAGVHRFLPKPYTADEMLRAIADVLAT